MNAPRSTIDRLDDRAKQWRGALLRRIEGRQEVMLPLGMLTGFGTGLAAAALIVLVSSIEHLAFGDPAIGAQLVVVPALGGLLAGLLVAKVPEAGGSGIVSVMRAIALQGGRFRSVVPIVALLATAVALGTGMSGGREAPMVLIGGAIGSLVGRLFAVGEEQMRSLVGAGVAAAIGASFNAPIGGMLFAVEFIIGGFRTRSSVQTIVVASVIGATTARVIIGPDVAFRPAVVYVLDDPWQLALYALLGVAAVGVGLLFSRVEHLVRRAAPVGRVHPAALLGLAGAGVGLIALLVPEVIGDGDVLPPIDGVREPILAMLNGTYGVGGAAALTLVGLLLAKLVATAVTVGVGAPVGSFAPLLFLGAALGGAFAAVADGLFPGLGVQPGAFALVGMAAVFAAAARGPLTAVVLAFEMTSDYEMILPLMVAAGLAAFLADRVSPESLYLGALRREGIVYHDVDDVDIMQTVQVGEVMTTDVQTVPHDLDWIALKRRFAATGHHGFCVTGPSGDLFGIVTLQDLRTVEEQGDPDGRRLDDLRVEDICTRRPSTVVPEDPVFRAIRRMAALDVGRLPVVAPDDHSRLVGVLRRPDLVRAYQRAVTRSAGAQQRNDRSRLRDLTGVQFVEFAIEPGAAVAGREVKEVTWPDRTVITSIRRDGETVVPRGDTVLHSGDELVLLTGRDAQGLRELFAADVVLPDPPPSPSTPSR